MSDLRLTVLLFLAVLLTGCYSPAPDSGAASIAVQKSSTAPARTASPAVFTADSTLALTAPPLASRTPQDTLAATPTIFLPGASPTLPATSPTAAPTLDPGGWMALPVIPVVSDHTLAIFRHGLDLGNNSSAFSKIGDCGSTPAWFLGDFDRGERFYSLGNFQKLLPVIQAYSGSFGRTSLGARSGFNASSLMVNLWTDIQYCKISETPLECEYRLHRPSIAFIMLGTNDIWHPEEFEPQMRKIIEFSIEKGVIPILTTKADNQEKDHSINATIARLAQEYDVPLWNFWLAVQSLPDQGLQEDRVHLTWGRNFFDDAEAMTKAWPLRNLTALQALEAIWLKLAIQE